MPRLLQHRSSLFFPAFALRPLAYFATFLQNCSAGVGNTGTRQKAENFRYQQCPHCHEKAYHDWGFLVPILFLLSFSGCKTGIPTQTAPPEEILWTANWSADGKYIAVGGNHNRLLLFSGKDSKLLREYPLENTITKLRWHPDGALLAVATQISADRPFILDISSGRRIELEGIANDGARGLGWSAEGELLAVGDNVGQLSIFTKNGDFVKKTDVKQKSITGLSWHPTENIIATVGSQIAIFDLDKDTLMEITPRPEEVLMLCVAWHPSGALFVTGDYGDFEKHYPPLLQFWSSNGEKLKEIELSKAEFRNLKWSDDGKTLATASDALRIWSKDGELLGEGKSESLLWGIDWAPSGQKIVTSSEKGRILIWNEELNVIKQIKY